MRNDPRQWTPEQLADYRRALARGENIKEDSREGGTVITYQMGEKLLAAAWHGKAAKCSWHYCFRTESQRQAAIDGFWQGIEARAKFKQNRATQQRSDREKLRQSLEVGTILSGSWGYDQTNAEVYQVVDKRGAFVWIRPVCCETVPGSEGFMSQSIRPIPGKFCGEAIKRLIGPHGVKLHECCHLSPCSVTASHYSSWYA